MVSEEELARLRRIEQAARGLYDCQAIMFTGKTCSHGFPEVTCITTIEERVQAWNRMADALQVGVQKLRAG